MTQHPDPDPRHVPEDDLWDPQAAAWVPRPSVLWALLVGALAGAVLGFLVAVTVVHAAAPRPSQEVGSPTLLPARTGAPFHDRAEARSVRGSAYLSSGAPSSPASGASPEAASLSSAGQTAGFASYCAPTPTHCQSWGGDAHLAAVPSFRYGDRPYTVIVHYRARQTTVRVVSYCACGTHVIDLSPAAFAELAPLGLGSIPVSIERAGPTVTPPPTDTNP